MTGLVLTTAVVGLTAVAPSGAAAHGGGDAGGDLKRVRILDDCEQRSFDAAIGAGTCVGDGETTFDEFIAEFGATGAVEDWEFKPSEVDLERGEGLHAVNRGGEFHTFTEVAAFGPGCVPELNQGQSPVPECGPAGGPPSPLFFQTLIGPEGSLDIPNLTPGTHKFECLIHPWMRTTVVVGAHH